MQGARREILGFPRRGRAPPSRGFAPSLREPPHSTCRSFWAPPRPAQPLGFASWGLRPPSPRTARLVIRRGERWGRLETRSELVARSRKVLLLQSDPEPPLPRERLPFGFGSARFAGVAAIWPAASVAPVATPIGLSQPMAPDWGPRSAEARAACAEICARKSSRGGRLRQLVEDLSNWARLAALARR